MASREMRRIRDRLSGKDKKTDKDTRKLTPISVISIVIIGLVLIGLVIGLGSPQGGGGLGAVVFGYYDGHPITWKQGNYFSRKIEEAKQYHKDVPYQIIAEFLLPYMRYHTAALVEAERNGIFVSDQEVENYIKGMGPETLRSYNRQPTARYEMFSLFKEEMIEQKFTAALVRYTSNQALDDFAATMGADEKSFRFVEWRYENYPIQEISRFADENKALFRSIKLSRITAKSENDAKAAYDKIVSGESTFVDQLKAVSKIEDESKAALDWQSFHSLERALGSKETAEKIFSLRQGEISEVVKLGSEWLIYRCDQEAKPADLSSEPVILEVKSYILETQKGRVETYFETKAKEFLAGAAGKDLTGAAAAAGLTAGTTGFFPLNYGPGKGSTLPFLKTIPAPVGNAPGFESAQYSRQFFTKGFSLKKGAVSQPILLEDKVVVCELIDERQADAAELAKVKSNFTAFRAEDFANFLAIIRYHFFTRGAPQMISPAVYDQLYRTGQIFQYQDMLSYDLYQAAAYISQSPVFRAVFSSEKAGTPEERAAWEAKGLEEFSRYFGSNQ